jgi:hypothetical protein
MRRSALIIVLLGAVGCGGGGPFSAPASPAWSADQQKAVSAAAQLLKEQGLEWGAPDSVELGKDQKAYWITYPTPAEQIKVLGPRSVTVDAATWKAELVPRD